MHIVLYCCGSSDLYSYLSYIIIKLSSYPSDK